MQMRVVIRKIESLWVLRLLEELLSFSFALPMLINQAHTYVSVAGPSSIVIYDK